MWEEPDKAHALVKNGRYEGIPGAGDKRHQLLSIAEAADVALNEQERSVIERLSHFVLWAGRYPVPISVEKMKPVLVNGRAVAPSFFSPDDVRIAESLAERLMLEVEPWK